MSILANSFISIYNASDNNVVSETDFKSPRRPLAVLSNNEINEETIKFKPVSFACISENQSFSTDPEPFTQSFSLDHEPLVEIYSQPVTENDYSSIAIYNDDCNRHVRRRRSLDFPFPANLSCVATHTDIQEDSEVLNFLIDTGISVSSGSRPTSTAEDNCRPNSALPNFDKLSNAIPPSVILGMDRSRSASIDYTRCQKFDENWHDMWISDDVNLRLPVLDRADSSKPELLSINVDTLKDLLDGKFSDTIEEFLIVDCRYPYEYQGGHIPGSLNIFDPDLVNGVFIEKKRPGTVLIFHCEFSQQRAPTMCRTVRECDRRSNEYPDLCYPEIYLLEGGYKAFFNVYGSICFPPAYRQMWDKDFEKERKGFVQGKKSNTSKRKTRCPGRINSDSATPVSSMTTELGMLDFSSCCTGLADLDLSNNSLRQHRWIYRNDSNLMLSSNSFSDCRSISETRFNCLTNTAQTMSGPLPPKPTPLNPNSKLSPPPTLILSAKQTPPKSRRNLVYDSPASSPLPRRGNLFSDLD